MSADSGISGLPTGSAVSATDVLPADQLSSGKFATKGVTAAQLKTFINPAGAKDTSISTGVGSVKMKSANPATNSAWIPITTTDGTVYFVPGWTTNNP
jgi:hypothetical protein